MESQSPKIINEYVEKDKFFSEAFKENDGKNSNIQSRMSNNIREKQVLATFSGKSIQAKWTNNTSNLNEQLINNNKPWSLVLGSRSLTKERLKHELRCRSCFQPLVPHQISQCSHSHFFCLECTEQVNACCVCNINGRGPKRRLRSANNTPIIISAAEFENICPCCFARFYEWDDRHFKERPKCQELMLEQSEAGEQSSNDILEYKTNDVCVPGGSHMCARMRGARGQQPGHVSTDLRVKMRILAQKAWPAQSA